MLPTFRLVFSPVLHLALTTAVLGLETGRASPHIIVGIVLATIWIAADTFSCFQSFLLSPPFWDGQLEARILCTNATVRFGIKTTSQKAIISNGYQFTNVSPPYFSWYGWEWDHHVGAWVQ